MNQPITQFMDILPKMRCLELSSRGHHTVSQVNGTTFPLQKMMKVKVTVTSTIPGAEVL